MNKKLWITLGIIVLILITAGALYYYFQIYGQKLFKAGSAKIAAQSVAIVYHPYNEGINELADIIQSRVHGDVYKLEPLIKYPDSPTAKAERILKEQKNPDIVSLKKYNFDIKRYHIIFIGVPVIANNPSPVMMKFISDHKYMYDDSVIVIPFVYYQNNENTRDTFSYIYYGTYKATHKNGFMASFVNRALNEMNIDIWLNDIYFKHSELYKPKGEKAKLYRQLMKNKKINN